MDNTNKILIAICIIVIAIFMVLGVTMLYDSEEDLVGEVEIKEAELFMVEIANIEYIEESDLCVFISSSIEFNAMNIIFDYVREICYYDDYIIFKSQGITYMTNGKFTIINGVMI